MAWASEISATTLSLAATTNMGAVQNPGNTGDLKVSVAPGEIVSLEVKSNLPSTTDDMTVYIWSSNLDSPGDVPDAGRTYNGSDWAEYQTLLLDNGTDDDEWKEIIVSGVKWFAVSGQNSGATDTNALYVRYAKDGVDAQ